MGICGSQQIKKEHKTEQSDNTKSELEGSEQASFESSYSIESRLGSGGFGEVFLARNMTNHQTSVAKKIPLKQHVHTEVQIMLNLKHPHIIQLLDYYTLCKHLYIILEYLPGSIDLFDYIDQQGFLSESRARVIFSQLLQATSYLHHTANVAHLDIKPENIILKPETGLTKLIDFGAATQLTGEKSTISTTKFCGTRQYAAPEILFTKQFDPILADMWACGVTLYKMVTGHLPFQSSKDYQHPVKYSKTLSRGCVEVISALLQSTDKRARRVFDLFQAEWL